MMILRRRILPWVLLMVVLVVAAGWVAWLRSAIVPRMPSAVLRDGSVWRLMKASYGTNHQMVIGRLPELDDARRRWPWTQKVLGEPTESIQTFRKSDRSGICFFYHWRDAAGRNKPDPPWVQACFDEHGCRLDLELGRGESTFRGTNIAHQPSFLYPRRLASFEVEAAWFVGGSNDAVRVRVVNPRPWKGTNWVAEPFPASRAVDGMKVTLLGWGASERWPGPQFQVEKDGEVRPEWRATRTYFRDVTGNQTDGIHLCRHETAWEVESWFDRGPGADFGPDEAWTFHQGELPAAGTVTEREGSRTLQGVRVRLMAFGGPGRFEMERQGLGPWQFTKSEAMAPGDTSEGNSSGSDGNREWQRFGSTKPWVMVDLGGLDDDHSWRVLGRDSSGKWHEPRGWNGSGSVYTVPLDFGGNIQAEELKVVVQRYRKVAFIVPPPKIVSP